jgi:hypothetical protein
MKYSEVLKSFFRIGLDAGTAECIDLHFAGSSNAYYRHREAMDHAPELAEFHYFLFERHMAALCGLVYNRGDFSQAEDRSLKGLGERSAWKPGSREMPDDEMLGKMLPDARYALGQLHPYDFELGKAAVEQAIKLQKGDVLCH